jgi:hypothetical protein
MAKSFKIGDVVDLDGLKGVVFKKTYKYPRSFVYTNIHDGRDGRPGWGQPKRKRMHYTILWCIGVISERLPDRLEKVC